MNPGRGGGKRGRGKRSRSESLSLGGQPSLACVFRPPPNLGGRVVGGDNMMMHVSTWRGVCAFVGEGTALAILGPWLVRIVMQYCRRLYEELVDDWTRLIVNMRMEFRLKNLDRTVLTPKARLSEDHLRQLELLQFMLRRYIASRVNKSQQLHHRMAQSLTRQSRVDRSPALDLNAAQRAPLPRPIAALANIAFEVTTTAASDQKTLNEFVYGVGMLDTKDWGVVVRIPPMGEESFARCMEESWSILKKKQRAARHSVYKQTQIYHYATNFCHSLGVNNIYDQIDDEGHEGHEGHERIGVPMSHEWAADLYESWCQQIINTINIPIEHVAGCVCKAVASWTSRLFPQVVARSYDVRIAYDLTGKRPVEFNGVRMLCAWQHTRLDELMRTMQTNHCRNQQQSLRIERQYDEASTIMRNTPVPVVKSLVEWHRQTAQVDLIVQALQRLTSAETLIATAMRTVSPDLQLDFALPSTTHENRPAQPAGGRTILPSTDRCDKPVKRPVEQSAWGLHDDTLIVPTDFTVDQLLFRLSKM